MRLQKKWTLALLAAAAVAGGVEMVHATDATVDVQARLRQGISLVATMMDFTPSSEHIDFNGTPAAGVDYVTLGTDGSIAVIGSIFEALGAGQAGTVTITGDASSSVYISCSVSATLAEPSATTITVDALELSMNTGHAFGSADYTCAGVGTTPYSAYNLNGSDEVLLGGRLDGNSTIHTALYSSTDTADGGVAATVRVIYQ